MVETTGQPPATIQNKRAHNRSRGVSIAFETLCNRLKAAGERFSSEVLHSIIERVGSGQDGCMGWQSERNLRCCIFKDNRICCQSVNRGSETTTVPVCAYVICAEGVHSNQDDVWLRRDGDRFVSCGLYSARRKRNSGERKSEQYSQRRLQGMFLGCVLRRSSAAFLISPWAS